MIYDNSFCDNSFSAALEAAKDGKGIWRLGWNTTGVVVKVQFPDENSKMTRPYLYIVDYTKTPNLVVPWIPDNADIMADDWGIIL